MDANYPTRRGIRVQLDESLIGELNLLLTFPDKSVMQGIKIHHDADESLVLAAKRLFEKGVITHPDGGYLTDFGLELAEHAKKLHLALSKH